MLDSLSVSLVVLASVRFLGMLVFIDLYFQRKAVRYVVLILGWFAGAAGTAYALYTHTVLGSIDDALFSLLAALSTFWLVCGALLYFNAVQLRTVYLGAVVILLYGLLYYMGVNLGPAPGVLIQVGTALLLLFVTLFRRKTFWDLAHSSYLWLVGLALVSTGLTVAHGLGVFSGEAFPLGMGLTTAVYLIVIIFFLHLEHSISTRRIRESEQRYRLLSQELDERVIERTRELQEMQENLIQQERLAVLGNLASGIGHELRNPLAVINNAVYFLRMSLSTEHTKISEYLEIIDVETGNASRIINDLLDFGRVGAAERFPTQLDEVVTEALAGNPAPEHIKVEVDIPDDLQPVLVNERQISQALNHLLINAFQAMPDGGVLLITARMQDDHLELTVSDTGVGIPAEVLGRIYEPLFTTRARGIGLGLAVCKKLVEANEGRIEVDSKVGAGTSFSLIFPCARQRNER